MQHRFSIVIPTRERAHTLPYTLRTCLAQSQGDFEIIVADNFSSAPIRQIVHEFGDRRIKYVRAPRLLAMSDSWEFALSHAAGEFVTLLGNDDGLLLHALGEIDRLIQMVDAKILRWESVCYNWPDLPVQEHAPAHALLIPLKQENGYYPIRRCDSTSMIQAAANSVISYSELPLPYCSAIHHSVIDRLRSQAGRIFQSQSPDIFSSFAFAYMAGSYHSVAAPMNINALSGESNGVACLYLKGNSPVAEEFHRLNAQAKHTPHPLAPDVLVMPAAVADSFLRARDVLFAPGSAFTLDRKQLIVNCIHEARLAHDEEWVQFCSAIRRSLADDAELLAWFDREYGQRAWAALNPTRHAYKRYGGTYQYLDASEFGVSNVFEAAQLCEKLLGGQRDGLNCHLVPEPSPGPVGCDKRSAVAPYASYASLRGQEESINGQNSVAGLQWMELELSHRLSVRVADKCMIDVGAHCGTSLQPFVEMGWSVYAFEPIEANRHALAARFPGTEKLVIRSEAVSSETGTKAFHLALNLDDSLHEYNHSLEHILDDPWHKKGPTITVPTVSLDDLISRGDIPKHVGFLKIDTEGHDLAVLRGAAQLVCDAISVEFWGDKHAFGRSPSPASDMTELLRSRGYDSYIVICHDGDTTYALYSSFERVPADSWGNIVFFNKSANSLYRRLIEDRDWLLVQEMSSECDWMRRQLREKETVIQELDAAATTRLQKVEQLHAVAAERLQVIEELHQALHHALNQPSRLRRILKRVSRVLRGLVGVPGKNDAA